MIANELISEERMKCPSGVISLNESLLVFRWNHNNVVGNVGSGTTEQLRFQRPFSITLILVGFSEIFGSSTVEYIFD